MPIVSVALRLMAARREPDNANSTRPFPAKEWRTGQPAAFRQHIQPGSGGGNGAKSFALIGVPNGIRTRVGAVKGRCPGPLDDGDGMRRSGAAPGGAAARAADVNTPGFDASTNAKQAVRSEIPAAENSLKHRLSAGAPLALLDRLTTQRPFSLDRFARPLTRPSATLSPLREARDLAWWTCAALVSPRWKLALRWSLG
jgi:hypothetical protein